MFPQKEICYEIDIEKGIKMVKECKCDAIFILRATGVDDIERVALAGLRMLLSQHISILNSSQEWLLTALEKKI